MYLLEVTTRDKAHARQIPRSLIFCYSNKSLKEMRHSSKSYDWFRLGGRNREVSSPTSCSMQNQLKNQIGCSGLCSVKFCFHIKSSQSQREWHLIQPSQVRMEQSIPVLDHSHCKTFFLINNQIFLDITYGHYPLCPLSIHLKEFSFQLLIR